MESLNHRSLRYGDHSLQTVDVWERPVAERVPAEGSSRYFFMCVLDKTSISVSLCLSVFMSFNL